MKTFCDRNAVGVIPVLALIIVGGISIAQCLAEDAESTTLVGIADANSSVAQSISQADGVIRRAEAAFMQSRVAEAVDRYRLALELLDRALASIPRDHSDRALRERARTLRQKSLYALARVLRRQGEHAEALNYALRDHEDLLKRDDPLLQLIRQKSAVGIITDLIALSDYQRASAMLEDLTQQSDVYGPLKDVQRIFCVAMQAIISEQTGNDDQADPRWRAVGTEATHMLARIAQSRGRLADLWEPTHALLVASSDALSKSGDHRASDFLLAKFTLSSDEAGRRSFLSRMALLSILRRD
ncbi:MAG: tetratricopeptide (TPR) repeat protein, partial [Planctomycetaceae bacterium]